MSTPPGPALTTLPRDPAWVAATMEPGPNGRRFDDHPALLVPRSLPAGALTMYDATAVGVLPAGAPAYAGYYDGTFANMTALKARFPGAILVSVTPAGSHGAMYTDIEPGNVGPDSVPAFLKTGGLGFYASPAATGFTVQECIDACTRAGIPRSAYRIWSAH